MADSRTPALVMCAVAVVNIVAGLALVGRPSRTATAPSASRSRWRCRTRWAPPICARLLTLRLGGIDGPADPADRRPSARRRSAVAAGDRVRNLLRPAFGFLGTRRHAASLLGVAGSAAAVGGALYLLAAWRMTDELRGVAAIVGGRVRR